jgi:hypothetical protein
LLYFEQMPTLVILHIGNQWPHYLEDCIKQARIVNPVGSAEILFIVNQCHSSRCAQLKDLYTVNPIFIEDLQQTGKYREFLDKIVGMVDLQFRKSYWQYVFERFFILENYCLQYGCQGLYMIETDNMVYVPLQIVATSEKLFSQGMAAPFDNLEQGYPSIVFFRDTQAISDFTGYMLEILRKEYVSDMKILGKYRLEHPEKVFAYPVVPHSCNTPLRNRSSQVGHIAKAEETAFLSHPQFPILFDAIAYGQALGGIDPRNTNGVNTIGYVNESALYTIHEAKFGWMQLHSCWFPFVVAGQEHIPLVNLHIHSKALSVFLSNRLSMPGGEYNAKELENLLQTA